MAGLTAGGTEASGVDFMHAHVFCAVLLMYMCREKHGSTNMYTAFATFHVHHPVMSEALEDGLPVTYASFRRFLYVCGQDTHTPARTPPEKINTQGERDK